jgi:hypothetical protein
MESSAPAGLMLRLQRYARSTDRRAIFFGAV